MIALVVEVEEGVNPCKTCESRTGHVGPHGWCKLLRKELKPDYQRLSECIEAEKQAKGLGMTCEARIKVLCRAEDEDGVKINPSSLEDLRALREDVSKVTYQPRWIFLAGYGGIKGRQISDGDQGVCTLCWAEQDSTKGWKDHSRPLHKANANGKPCPADLAPPHPGADLLNKARDVVEILEADYVALLRELRGEFITLVKNGPWSCRKCGNSWPAEEWKSEPRKHDPGCFFASPHPGADLLAELRDAKADVEAAFERGALLIRREVIHAIGHGATFQGDPYKDALRQLGRVKALEGYLRHRLECRGWNEIPRGHYTQKTPCVECREARAAVEGERLLTKQKR